MQAHCAASQRSGWTLIAVASVFLRSSRYVTYLVFDAPQRSQKGMKYEQRVAWLEANIQPQSETTYAAVVGVCKCTGRDHLTKLLKQVSQSDGWGCAPSDESTAQPSRVLTVALVLVPVLRCW